MGVRQSDHGDRGGLFLRPDPTAPRRWPATAAK